LIDKLTLTDFGKFRGAAFDLKPVTFVFGPNEAGKTTFFDGLFQALCKPSETRKAGKSLKERYGAGRKASMSSAPADAVSEEEFLNLFATAASIRRSWSRSSIA
jgi:predicted ATP-binding protein involved in virulence